MYDYNIKYIITSIRNLENVWKKLKRSDKIKKDGDYMGSSESLGISQTFGRTINYSKFK